MARGKQAGMPSLKDSVPDNEIVRNGEVRNTPEYPFPDGEYGAAGGYRDYSLVKKRIAYRTGTEEDRENCNRVIEYTVWEDVPSYNQYMVDVFNSYARFLNMTEFKKKKMKGEISELVAIHKHTQDIINQALKGFDEGLNKEQKEVCHLIDKKNKLLKEIDELENDLDHYKKIKDDIESMHKAIKEKTKIIVNCDKPKQHKTVKEEE